MSRGGRGGFRGGGGAGGGPFGHDPDMPPDYSTTELFPPQPPPVPRGLSKEERHTVARYRLHREKIHTGPLYTVMGKKRGMEDAFNDVSKYSQKYKRQKRRAPKLDARPYVKEFFPGELWVTLGVEAVGGDGSKGGSGAAGRGGGSGGGGGGGQAVTGGGKKLGFSALDAIGGLGDLEEEDEGEGGEGGEGGKKKGVSRGLVGDDTAEDDDDDEAGEEEEEIEDDFGDDEEGDYNAEMYFDDGDNDGGDDWGEDGGGEDYY